MDGSFLFVIAAMFLIMWLMLIRPQRQQQRRHADMVAALKPGDEVITNGGLYGDVVSVEDDRVTLEIAEDVEVEVVKRAIATVVPPEDALDEADDDGAGDSEREREAAAEPDPRPASASEPGSVAADDAARR